MRSEVAVDFAATWAGRPPGLESAALAPGLAPIQAVGSAAGAVVGVLHSGFPQRGKEALGGVVPAHHALRRVGAAAGAVDGVGVVSRVVDEVVHPGVVAAHPYESLGLSHYLGDGGLSSDPVTVVIEEQAGEPNRVHMDAYTRRENKDYVYALCSPATVGVKEAR